MNRTIASTALIFLSLVVCMNFLIAANKPVTILTCSNCQTENQATNKHCLACGESLEDEAQELLTRQNENYLKTDNFIAERIDPPRLFNIPTARVLSSKDLNLTGGGAFGVGTKQSVLGTIGIGLGNIAEVEFSTIGLVNNIANGSPVVATSAFKLKLIPNNFLGISFFPTFAVAIRSSADWKQMNSDQGVVRANDSWNSKGINNIGYGTRFTVLYGVSSIRLGPISLHGGLSLTDIRIKDTMIEYWDKSIYEPTEKQKNLLGGFAGCEIASNPQTKIMLEIETVSNWEYNDQTDAVEVRQSYLAVGGVRFFFTKWFSIDTGVWYQNNFRGIADSQIKLSLNLFVPGRSIDKISGQILKAKKPSE
ncbi:MAG: zinc ribbon domain-containing protein [Candidatus Neomarinimicrobiota bacterium]